MPPFGLVSRVRPFSSLTASLRGHKNIFFFNSNTLIPSTHQGTLFATCLILKVLRRVNVGDEKLPYKAIKDGKQEAALTKLRKLQRACSLRDFFFFLRQEQ